MESQQQQPSWSAKNIPEADASGRYKKRVHLTESKAGIPRILPIGVTLSWNRAQRKREFNDQLITVVTLPLIQVQMQIHFVRDTHTMRLPVKCWRSLIMSDNQLTLGQDFSSRF